MFYGNFLVILRAYTYILMLGREGLAETSAHAVLNANYLMKSFRPIWIWPIPEAACMNLS